MASIDANPKDLYIECAVYLEKHKLLVFGGAQYDRASELLTAVILAGEFDLASLSNEPGETWDDKFYPVFISNAKLMQFDFPAQVSPDNIISEFGGNELPTRVFALTPIYDQLFIGVVNSGNILIFRADFTRSPVYPVTGWSVYHPKDGWAAANNFYIGALKPVAGTPIRKNALVAYAGTKIGNSSASGVFDKDIGTVMLSYSTPSNELVITTALIGKTYEKHQKLYPGVIARTRAQLVKNVNAAQLIVNPSEAAPRVFTTTYLADGNPIQPHIKYDDNTFRSDGYSRTSYDGYLLLGQFVENNKMNHYDIACVDYITADKSKVAICLLGYKEEDGVGNHTDRQIGSYVVCIVDFKKCQFNDTIITFAFDLEPVEIIANTNMHPHTIMCINKDTNDKIDNKNLCFILCPYHCSSTQLPLVVEIAYNNQEKLIENGLLVSSTESPEIKVSNINFGQNPNGFVDGYRINGVLSYQTDKNNKPCCIFYGSNYSKLNSYDTPEWRPFIGSIMYDADSTTEKVSFQTMPTLVMDSTGSMFDPIDICDIHNPGMPMSSDNSKARIVNKSGTRIESITYEKDSDSSTNDSINLPESR